jgi:hypothetical protein
MADDEEGSGRPSVMSDNFIQNVDKNVCEWWRFTILEVSCEFAQISGTVLYEIITVRARLWLQVLRKSRSENDHGAQIGFSFGFLERYHKDGAELLNHVVWVAGIET